MATSTKPSQKEEHTKGARAPLRPGDRNADQPMADSREERVRSGRSDRRPGAGEAPRSDQRDGGRGQNESQRLLDKLTSSIEEHTQRMDMPGGGGEQSEWFPQRVGGEPHAPSGPLFNQQQEFGMDGEPLNAQQELHLSDDNLARLRQVLIEHNLPLDNPVLIVEVLVNRQTQDGADTDTQQTRFTFTKEDLVDVFEIFGALKEVELFDSNEIAYITFEDFFAAFYAQQALNGYFLASFGVYLQVKWMPSQAQQQGHQLSDQHLPQTLRSQNGESSSTRQVQQQRSSQQQPAPPRRQTPTEASQPTGQVKPRSLGAGETGEPEPSTNLSQTTSAQPFIPSSFPGAAGGESSLMGVGGKFEQENVMTAFPQQPFGTMPFIPSSQGVMPPAAMQSTIQSYQSQQQQQAQGIQGDGISQDPASSDGSAKYTCRYDIQIPNDREFQVARRLIGAKGCNMKRIISQCSKNMPEGTEVVKLRLRGKGSGFKEGPKQEESKEPLHLCISSRFYQQYMMACSQIETLLLNVYEEFKKHCEKQKKDIVPIPGNGGLLQIKKFETVTGRRTQIQPLPHTYPQGSLLPKQQPPNGFVGQDGSAAYGHSNFSDDQQQHPDSQGKADESKLAHNPFLKQSQGAPGASKLMNYAMGAHPFKPSYESNQH